MIGSTALPGHHYYYDEDGNLQQVSPSDLPSSPGGISTTVSTVPLAIRQFWGISPDPDQPTFDILGPASVCDIKVGYISSTRGYIDGLTRHEANLQAQKDPGTQFIFKKRDLIQYLNINEVNALTVDDLLPSTTGPCIDVLAANASPQQNTSQSGSQGSFLPGYQLNNPSFSPYITIHGGGGVGATANPIFDADGKLLSVDVVEKGYGYTSAPEVKLNDDTKIGGGAVLVAKLCEPTDPVIITYEDEEDYEEYDLTTCRPSTLATGNRIRWGPNGEILGIWDPSIYANLSKDPIAQEIQNYQDFLFGGIKPWWHTRKHAPISVTSSVTGTKRTKWDVWHTSWDANFTDQKVEDSFMNRYAISPVAPSDVPGSDYAGIMFSFIWEEDFPYEGEYIFRSARDDEAHLYLDNVSVMDVEHFRGRKEVGTDTGHEFKAHMSKGVHQIRLDLWNDPIKEYEINQHAATNDVTFTFSTAALYSSETIIPELGIHITKDYKGPQINETYIRTLEPGKRYEVIVSVPEAKDEDGGVRLRTKGKNVLQVEEASDMDWMDVNVTGVRYDENGGTPDAIQGEFIISEQYAPEHNVHYFGLNDSNNPIKVTSSGKRIELKDSKGDDANVTFTIDSGNAIFTSDGRKIRASGKVKLTLWYDDNPDYADQAVSKIQIEDRTWIKENKHHGEDTQTIDFGGTGTSALSAGKEARCYFVIPVVESKIVPIDSNFTEGTFADENIFNTVDWMNKANRQLWRTNVFGRGGFLNEYGVCPFDTLKTLDHNPYAGSHNIKWSNINFPIDGNYTIDVEVDDNVNLVFEKTGTDKHVIDIRKVGFQQGTNNSTGMTSYVKFFKAGTYNLSADLEQIPGGRFGFDIGQTGQGNVEAKFNRSHGANPLPTSLYENDFYVDVRGSGSAQITFTLMSSDTADSGYAASEIRIDSDQGKIKLKRNLSVSKETLTATGEFSAGRKYKIDIIGGPTTGRGKRLVDDRTIEMFDTNSDDFDLGLLLTKIDNQIPSNVKGINPMSLAVNVKVAYSVEKIISPRSWMENPMGVAMTIEAPMPPIPQEIPVDGEGRCPKSPTWTTRYPGAQEHWWPVNGEIRWGQFMNRYAISPVPPLATPDSDEGGIEFVNTWKFHVDYPGYHALKGTVDRVGKIWIDGKEMVHKDWDNYNLSNYDADTYESNPGLEYFKVENPKSVKIYLEEGEHEIKVMVMNKKTDTLKFVDKEVFNTANWAVQQEGNRDEESEVTFKVGSGSMYANSIEIVGLFKEEKGFTKGLKNEADLQIDATHTFTIPTNKVYDVVFHSHGPGKVKSSPPLNEGFTEIKYKGMADENLLYKDAWSLQFDDNPSNGFDQNAWFTIDKGNAKFAKDGRSIEGDGDVQLTLGWDDNPDVSGRALKSIRILDKKWTITQDTTGSETHTIKLSKSGSSSEGSSLTLGDNTHNIKLRNRGESVIEMEDLPDEISDWDWTDIVCSATRGKFFNLNGNKAQYMIVPEVSIGDALLSGTTIDGVTYEGPELASYRNEALGPSLTPAWDTDDQFRREFMGRQWTSIWRSVTFPSSGVYTLKAYADDWLRIWLIDNSGNEIELGDPPDYAAEVFEHIREYNFNASSGVYDIRMDYYNIPGGNHNTFWNNPVVFSAIITTKEAVSSGISYSWKVNPVAISAVLLPPPCPREVKGKGQLCEIEIIDRGTNYPPALPPTVGIGTTSYSVILPPGPPIIDKPGINYNCKDDIVKLVPDIGVKAKAICGGFGKITRIDLEYPPGIGYTTPPKVEIDSPTGSGLRTHVPLVPIRDPIGVDPDQLIQVTDLVGLKQTGYYDGRPYYGAVFYEDGIRYAGYYATPGQKVQIYDTLQESIDGMVTTPPSAIQRSGTDITSNDPGLNIPGTPDNLV